MLTVLARFRLARDGVAAVEFALIAPILVAMFLGTIELTDALDCQQRVTGLSSTAADLIAQETAVTTSDLSNVYSAVNSIVYPYSTSGMTIVVTSLVDNGSGTGKVAWSCAQHTTARAANSVITVPTGAIATGGSVILAEVSYPYTSPLSDYITGTLTMTSQFYSRPRRSTTIAGPASCP